MARFSLSPLLTLLSLFTVTLLLLPKPASAGTKCSAIFGCGVVYNDTPYPMKYTINPNPKKKKSTPDLCYIWNWSGWFSNNADTVWCKQETIPAHNHRGGGSAKTKIDVDAYCFADRDYWAEGSIRTKGVWTRIHDGTKVHCRDGEVGPPICEND